MLPHQLQLADADFFSDALIGSDFLRASLGLLVRGAMHPSADPTLHNGGASLQNFVRDKFSVSLATQPALETEEDRPVVLDSTAMATAGTESVGLSDVEAIRTHDTDVVQLQHHDQRMTWMIG